MAKVNLQNIQETIEEMANEIVAQELMKLAKLYSKKELGFETKRASGKTKSVKSKVRQTKVRKTSFNGSKLPNKVRRRPRGAINNAVLASMTSEPMFARELAERVRRTSPKITDHQVVRSLNALWTKKACVRSGKQGQYKYNKV